MRGTPIDGRDSKAAGRAMTVGPTRDDNESAIETKKPT